MTSPNPSDSMTMLPHAAPADAAERLLLFAIRRMAAGGINDAFAAQAMLGMFGRSFRRPLVLLRATMAEVARISGQVLMVAPCCCPRVTAHERALIDAIVETARSPLSGHARLSTLLRVTQCPVLVDNARALVDAFADLGRPIAPA